MESDAEAPEPTPTREEKRARRAKLKALEEALAAERLTWERWFPKWKRAFNRLDKINARMRRLERQIAKLKQP